MEDNAWKMSMLFDFYGDILSERQREFFDLYHNEDLSLTEIAELSGITRQGVRDVLVRAEGAMTELEEKTGMIARYLQNRKAAEAIETAVAELRTLNSGNRQDPHTEELLNGILEQTAAIKE